MNTTESFSRYEFKYILSKKKSDQIELECKHFMKFDENVKEVNDNKYFVRSLYFDNIESVNFFDKVDGIKTRRKFRLRTYTNVLKDNESIYLEMKGRHNQRTYKIRTKIKNDHLKFFYNEIEYPNLLKYYDKDNPVINAFIYDGLKKKILPKVLIDYNRRPYLNKSGLNFRLTFDSQIATSTAKSLFMKKNQLFWKKCRPGYTILEVKFDRSIAPWFHRMIQNYNLKRLSISKFVLGMEYCNIAEETSD